MHGEEDARGMGMFLIQALVDEAEWVAARTQKQLCAARHPPRQGTVITGNREIRAAWSLLKDQF